jgi:hypothetical protein
VTDRRCETCRHWEAPDRRYSSRQGVCNGIEGNAFSKPEPMAEMATDPPAGCTLFTLPEFFCAMHKEKP